VPIVRSTDAPTFDLQGSTVTGLASPSRGATETMTYTIAMPADATLPRHRHDHEEVFYVSAGALVAVLGEDQTPVGAGDAVIIPAGVWHHSFTESESATLVVAMPSGTRFMPVDGGDRLPPWGE
jgi:quercetin dioxygenase-like cupin family protein